MAYIAGLSDAVKYSIKEYCRDHRITMVAWIEGHLSADLASDAAQNLPIKEEAVL